MQTATASSPKAPKNKTLAAWLAFITGQLGIHRLYLFGLSDVWAWLHPIAAALGWWGVERVRLYGQDDHLAWVLIPLLGFTLAGTALTAIYYGLMPTEKWNALHNAGTPATQAGNTTAPMVSQLVLPAWVPGVPALCSAFHLSVDIKP